MLIEGNEDRLSRCTQYLQAKERDTVELTDTEKEWLEKRMTLHMLIMRHGIDRGRRMYQTMYQITYSTAQRHYNDVTLLIGNSKRTNKDFLREMTLLEMDSLKEKALETGDLKTAASILFKKFEWATKEEELPPFDPDELSRPLILVRQIPERFQNADLPKTEAEMEAWLKKMHAPKNIAEHAEEIDYRELGDELTGSAPE